MYWKNTPQNQVDVAKGTSEIRGLCVKPLWYLGNLNFMGQSHHAIFRNLSCIWQEIFGNHCVMGQNI